MRTRQFFIGSTIFAVLFSCIVFGEGCSSASGGGGESPSFTVTYYTEHGSSPASIKVEENTALSSAQLPTLYADGYTFNEWLVGSTATSASGYKVTSDITLTANWTKNDYTITFEKNGGTWTSGYTPISAYTIEDEITLPAADKLSKSDAAFKGWFEEDVVSIGSTTAGSSSASPVTKIEKGTFGDKTFYAKWADSIYSIQYEGTNDAIISEGVTLENGFSSEDTQITLPTAEQISRTGYTFSGWFKSSTYSESDAITVLTKDSASKGETLTLYAKWTPVEYTITYNLDGGTWASGYTAVLTYTIEDEVTLPDASSVTKAGYDLEGWYEVSTSSTNTGTSSTSSSPVTKIEKGTTGDKTFKANWTLATYTITYKNVDGANYSNPESYTLISDTITLTDASKAGYTFKGWYFVNDGVVSETPATEIPKGTTGNITLYAKWTAIEYKVSFNLNLGTWADGYTAISSYTIEDEVTLPTAENITRSGYTFDGWFENSADRDLPDPPAPATSIPKGSTGSKTFYAKWTKTTYTITYENVQGADNSANATYYEELTTQSVPITLNTPSKAGYTFEGWYFVNDGVVSESPATEIPKGTTGDVTLYAKWSVITYTITIETNGGELAGSYTPASSYTVESEEIALPTSSEITRTGYTFDGWFENEDLTGEAVSSIPKGTTGDKTFYAKWTAIVYTITYKNADGAENSNPSTYTIEDAVILKEPSKTGYTFDAWYKTEDFSEIASLPKGSTGDKTFYAKFIPYQKKISFYSNYTYTKDSAKPYYNEIKVIDPTVDDSKYLYTQTIIFGEETSFIPVNFYSDKWLFAGWNTAEDGSGTSYSDKAKVLWNAQEDSSVSDDVVQITESNPTSILSTLNLYAQWTAKTSDIYSITLPEADDGDIALSKSGTELTAKFTGFTGTYYWYIDGSDTETYSSATRTDEESTTDLSTYSTLDVAQYLGKEGTSYGVHSVMVKIEYNGNVYTQTAFVSLSPWN